MLKQLSETRKADRIVMAQSIETLLKRLNVKYERLEPSEGFPGPRCIMLRVNANDLCVTVDFDGDSSQPDVYVLSWHIDHHSDKQLNDATFGGSVNKFHKHKATYITHTFEGLCYSLEQGLKKAIDGSAFL